MRSTCLWTLGILFLLGTSGWIETAALAQNAAPSKRGNLVPYIAPDFCAAIVVHPTRIMKSPLAAALPMDQAPMMAAGAAGDKEAALMAQLIDPKKIRRAVILIDPTPIADSPVSGGVILQFEEDVDSEGLLSQAFDDVESAEWEGKTYLKSESAGQDGVAAAAYVADPRTLLLGPEPTMQKMLTPSDEPRPLLTQLRRCNLKNDIIVEVLADRLAQNLAKAASQGPPEMQQQVMMATGMLQEVKTASLAVNFSGDTLLELTLAGAKPDSADKLHGQLSFLKMMATQQLKATKEKPAEGMPGPMSGTLTKLGEELLGGLSVNKQDDQVVVTLKTPDDLPGMLQELTESAAQMMMSEMGEMEMEMEMEAEEFFPAEEEAAKE